MKPEAPSQNINTEPTVQYEQNIERFFSLPTPETGVERSAESFEVKSELNAVASNAVSTASQINPIVQVSQSTSDDSIIGTLPVVASDDELIEKEWVDKAKKIVAETKDDPYKREEAVNKLQVDYLKKRYGRELGVSE